MVWVVFVKLPLITRYFCPISAKFDTIFLKVYWTECTKWDMHCFPYSIKRHSLTNNNYFCNSPCWRGVAPKKTPTNEGENLHATKILYLGSIKSLHDNSLKHHATTYFYYRISIHTPLVWADKRFVLCINFDGMGCFREITADYEIFSPN